jgi:hypothetical protein
VTPLAPNATTTPTGTEPTAPTHGCARCGRPVPIEVGLCEECNPLGLPDVSASQVHGTVIITVLVGFVILAILARLAVSGVGPFPASLSAATPTSGGLAVTLSVTNEGENGGQTTCRVFDPEELAGGAQEFVLTPRVEPGETIAFDAILANFGTAPVPLAIECRTP